LRKIMCRVIDQDDDGLTLSIGLLSET
jgi:hypothetical protein